MSGMLKVENLTKRFGGLVAVNNLSFELEENGIHSLIGPNGSGKTTSINLISGSFPADEGSIKFQGTEIVKEKPFNIARLGLRRTYQDLKLFNSMSILDNIMIGTQYKTEAGMIRSIVDHRKYREEEKFLREKAEETLHLIGLYDRRKEEIGSQPYGIRKMTSIGVAIASDPAFLLLDEPAAGLNPSERAVFVDMVLKIYDMGIKILIVEHNMDVVMNISKKVTVLNFGSKIAEGTPDEIKNNDEVIKAYLGRKFQKPGHGEAGERYA